MTERLFADAEAFRDDVLRIGPASPPEPHWKKGRFPRLNALNADITVRRETSRRICEIGARHFTRFMARELRDGEIDCEFVSVDPQPRAALDGLAGHMLLR